MNARTHVLPLATIIAAVLGATSAKADQPVLVTAPVEKVFVPNGFDDNDNVEIAIHGHFSNTCYKTGPVTATVDEAARTVTVDAKAYHYIGVGCAQVLVPFMQSVQLGPIGKGAYEIIVLDRPDASIPQLVVGEARTNSPDDYLYAPVSQVSLDEQGAGQYTVKIEGEYPLTLIGCMVIREIRTYTSPGNTLVVMPIAAFTDGPECAPQRDTKKFSFTKSVGALAPEEYLIHVRVLEGNSLNRFVDLTH